MANMANSISALFRRKAEKGQAARAFVEIKKNSLPLLPLFFGGNMHLAVSPAVFPRGHPHFLQKRF
jgi:hypothetical protein